MKRFNFKQMAVFAMFALAAISAQAQTTPEAIIGQCPAPPKAETLALLDVYGNVPDEKLGTLALKVEEARKEKAAFLEKIKALHQIRKDVAEKADAQMEAAGKNDADRLVRQKTGRSLGQVQNMSDAEAMKMTDNMVSEKLGSMELGNMSLGDLQALEGKSDEEILKAFEGVAPAQIGAKQKQSGNPKAQAELKKISDRRAEIDRLNNRDITGAQTQLKAIYEKYRVTLKEKSDILLPFQDGKGEQKLFDNGYEAALANYRAVMYRYLTECYTNWEKTVKAVKERTGTKLSDAARYDELMAKNMSAGGVTAAAKALPSAGYDIAGEYLEAAASIVSPPLPELDMDGAAKD
jgi:hypothetical protein